MFSLIALYFAHRRLAADAARKPHATGARAVAANETHAIPLPLAA